VVLRQWLRGRLGLSWVLRVRGLRARLLFGEWWSATKLAIGTLLITVGGKRARVMQGCLGKLEESFSAVMVGLFLLR
jgi:hypothetical protein